MENLNLEPKSSKKQEPITIENLKSWLNMKMLPREDYGDFWLDHWVSESNAELFEYINKKSGKIEKRLLSQGENPIGEVLYDQETGGWIEMKKYYKETGELEEVTKYDAKTGDPQKILRYGKNGKVIEDIDEAAVSEVQKAWNRQVIEAISERARSLTDEEIERLKTMLLFENLAMREKLMGRDPDVKH